MTKKGKERSREGGGGPCSGRAAAPARRRRALVVGFSFGADFVGGQRARGCGTDRPEARSIPNRSTAFSRDRRQRLGDDLHQQGRRRHRHAHRVAQMAAEELGVPIERVSVIDGDTARCPNTGGTGGSTGLTRGGTAVRQAAATARQHLLSSSPHASNVPPPSSRFATAGFVPPAQGGSGIAIAKLVGPARRAPGRPQAPLRPPLATPSSARHRRGRTYRRSARDATSTSRTSPCRACCTRGSCVRRRSARRLVSVDESSIRAAFPASA